MNRNLRPLAKCVTAPSSGELDVQALEMAMDCLGLNRTTLSRRLGVKRDTVRRWLLGEASPTIRTLCASPEFAQVFGDCLAQLSNGQRSAA